MKQNKEMFRAFSLVSQLGISVLSPMILCVIVGELLQKWLQVDLMLLLVILGLAAGMRSGYMLLREFIEFEKKKD